MIINLRRTLFAVACLAGCQAYAGSLFYVPISPTGSDASAGLDRRNIYTSAVDGGNVPGGELEINGVKFTQLAIDGATATAQNLTYSADTGTLATGGGKTASIHADGALAAAFSSFIFNADAGNGSEQYLVLDPAGLKAGTIYDLRIYIANASGQNRQVDLTFAGDDQPQISTDYFNEDDATTSPGGFADENQVYYVNYRFTWDGETTPGVTITSRNGSTPFCLYAATNQEVPADAAASLPPGALAEAPPAPQAPIALQPPAPAARGIYTSSEPQPSRSARDYDTDDNDSDEGVSSEVFYDSESLRNDGQWVEVGGYGRCWQPTRVAANWSPYTVGRWRYASDGGWAWDSDEPWGWATYHYGRWFRARDTGWCWVPGRVWAPSWCSWRTGGGHVGWAPLPPESRFRRSVGISTWVDATYDIGPGSYNFCNVRDLGAPLIGAVILPRQQNVTIINNTTNITNITYNKNIVYAGGPNFTTVNNTIVRGGGKAFVPVRIDRRNNAKPYGPGGKHTKLDGNVLSFAAPTIHPDKNPKAGPRPAKTIAKPQIEKGWEDVKDPRQADKIRGRIRSETKGLTPDNSPATLPGAIDKSGDKPADGAPDTVGPDGKPVHPQKGSDRPGKGNRPGKGGRPGAPIHEGDAGKPAPGETPSTLPAPGKPGEAPGPDTTPDGKPDESGKPGRRPGKNGRPGAKEGDADKLAPGETPSTLPDAGKPGEAPGPDTTPDGKPDASGKPGRRPEKGVPGTPEKPGDLTPGKTPGDVTPSQPEPEVTPGDKESATSVTKPGKAEKPGKPGKPGKNGHRGTPEQTAPATSEVPAEKTPDASAEDAPSPDKAPKPGHPGNRPGAGKKPGHNQAPVGIAPGEISAQPKPPVERPGDVSPGSDEPTAPAGQSVPEKSQAPHNKPGNRPGKPGKHNGAPANAERPDMAPSTPDTSEPSRVSPPKNVRSSQRTPASSRGDASASEPNEARRPGSGQKHKAPSVQQRDVSDRPSSAPKRESVQQPERKPQQRVAPEAPRYRAPAEAPSRPENRQPNPRQVPQVQREQPRVNAPEAPRRMQAPDQRQQAPRAAAPQRRQAPPMQQQNPNMNQNQGPQAGQPGRGQGGKQEGSGKGKGKGKGQADEDQQR